MARNGARGAIRASRRRTLKRLVVHPPKTRKAMLGASALVGGALGNLAAFVARPRPVAKWARRGAALAAGMVGSALLLPVAAWAVPDGCNAANTYTWTCKGTVSTPGGPYAPSGSDYSFTFKGNGGATPHPYVLTSSTTFTVNSPGLSGELDFNSGSSITNLVGNALVINSTVGNEVSSVTVIMDGQVRAGYDGDNDHNADGLRVVGGSINEVTIKVGKNDPTAVIEGSDDGIFINPDNIAGEDAKVTITNYGTVAGMGMSGDASNASEGIHISGGGTTDNPNGYAGDGYQVDAAVEIDNYGTVSGQLEHSAESFDAGNPGGLGGGGQGISVSANSKINIDNGDNGYTGATITGSEGVFAYGGGNHNIILTNYGHIEGTNGDGADLANANDITVENHSLGSMIGATNGQEISYANTATYDNSGGLTAGLGGDGLSIHNINGATSNIPEYAVTVLNTVEDGGSAGGIIVGSTSGVSMYGIDLGVPYVSGQNGVLVDNSGSSGGWHSDAPDVAGGLIVGETGNGVEITGSGGIVGDVTIDNSNTRNGAGNDLSAEAIDPAVGYDGFTTDTDPPGTTLLDAMVHGSSEPYTYDLNYVLSGGYAPDAPDGGITTGIWGGGSGVYMQNIAGMVSVDNSHGQIFGAGTDGIQLWDVGTGVTPGDLSQDVVNIDNSYGGLVEGGTNGVDLEGVHNGSVYYNNDYGTTLGGTNGIYIGLANVNNVSDTLSVDGNVTIQNEDGLIGGATGDGISIDEVGGNVSISNDKGWGWWGDGGTIAGGTNGVVASNIGGSFYLDNERGLALGLDGNGVYVQTAGNTATVDNSGGVIGGLQDASADGVRIDSTGGIGSTYGDYSGLTYSVVVENTAQDHGHQGGVIAGNEDGVYIHNVTTASGDTSEVDPVVDAGILIDNSGSTSWNHHHLTQTPGGLIVGITGDGIHIDGVTKGTGGTGGVTIDNSYTRDNGSNNITSDGWGSIDTDVASAIDGPLDDAVGDDFLRVAAQTTGIWGLDGSGISGVSIGGEFYVDNVKGQIVGSDDSGILLSGVGGQLQRTVDINGNVTDDAVYIDNSNGGGDSWWARRSAGGLITGGDYGIRLTNINNGNVILDNTKGTVYGDEMAFALGGDGTAANQGLNGGDVYIYNSGGLIEGHNGTSSVFGGTPPGADSLGAITINNVQGVEGAGGHVYISNGNEDGEDGGSILGISTASAISIGSYLDPETGAISANANTAVDTADIYNGSPHNIWSFYEGDSDGPITGGLIAGTGGANTPVILLNTSSTYINDGENEANGYIYNNGVIASTNIEDFVDPDSDGNPQTDLRDFLTDAYGAGNYVESDGLDSDLGIDGLQTALQNVDNNGAATDNLIQSSVGAVWIENYGAMLGTINLTGSNSYYTGVEDETATAGNEIDNYNAWFTQGTNTANAIRNEGLIQTAFAQGTTEGDVYTPTLSSTTFTVDDFYNDTPTAYTGVLSSLDGQAGDTITIDGNFHGGTYAAEHPENVDVDAVYSVVALDAYLDKPVGDGGSPSADLLTVTGDVAAETTTALIINNTNSSGLGEMNSDGIQVVQVDGASGGCLDAACVDGDTFYISSASANYVEANGVGVIQQGTFYAWYLTERTPEDVGGPATGEGYYLVTEALPETYQVPAVTSGFVNIFYAGTDLVSEHLYGGHFPSIGSGGGGDDVTPQGPDQSKKDNAVWARVSGSWSNQASSVDAGSGAFDTGFNQNTYTLLGGIDGSPNGGSSGFRFGAYGGYVQSDMSFTSYGTTGKYTGGEIGAYAAYTQGGFYVDAQVDADFLNVNYDATLGSTLVNANTDGSSLGVVANIGNRFYKGASFIEPLASFAYANMTLGDVQTGGATISFSDGESLRGGVGGRIGTTVKSANGWLTEFSLLGRLWNEFAGNNTVTISDGSNTNTFTNDIGGIYEEVSGTVTFADTKTNLSTFLSGGAMFGSDSTTWNAKAGVRKEF